MDGRKRSDVKPGMLVNIVQKHHQRTGELTEGIVKHLLTNAPNHPHGIKVRLETGEVGRVKEILEEDKTNYTMKVISMNIGNARLIEWRGQQVSTGIYKYPVSQPVLLEAEDVKDDHVIDRRYHGGKDKACYLYSADCYDFWKTKYPDADWNWGMFGENLTVEGLNESEIRIGDIFQIGSASVQVSQPRQPCFKLGVRFGDQQVVDDFWHLPFPGVYVRVLQSGWVKTGDEMTLIERNPESLTVAEVFSVFRLNRERFKLMEQAIADPLLAESCRKDIRRILESEQDD